MFDPNDKMFTSFVALAAWFMPIYKHAITDNCGLRTKTLNKYFVQLLKHAFR